MPTPNWKNRTMWTGDNLPILRGLNSESVDLIYLDPPFNSKKTYSAPIGSKAAGVSFKDFWTFDDVDRMWFAVQKDTAPKFYRDIHSVEYNYAVTWEARYIWFANSPERVLSSISQGIDRFILEYLRVNGEDCGGPV